jgi:hypothetical protein
MTLSRNGPAAGGWRVGKGCPVRGPERSKTPAMQIGRSESILTIAPARWQKMARESSVGWPMPRERTADLCGKVLEELQDQEVLAASDRNGGGATGLMQERSASSLPGLK